MPCMMEGGDRCIQAAARLTATGHSSLTSLLLHRRNGAPQRHLCLQLDEKTCAL
jgi:hypothetical protein